MQTKENVVINLHLHCSYVPNFKSGHVFESIHKLLYYIDVNVIQCCNKWFVNHQNLASYLYYTIIY